MIPLASPSALLRTLEKIWFPQMAEEIPQLRPRTRVRLHRIMGQPTRSIQPALDALEGRLVMDAGLLMPGGELELLSVTLADSQGPGETVTIDPADVVVTIGPGENRLVPPSDAVDEVDPTTLPVFAGPGDNELVESRPNDQVIDPGTIPVFAGPGENELVSTPLPATEVGLALAFGRPLIVVSSPRLEDPITLPANNPVPPTTMDTSQSAPVPSERSRPNAGIGGSGTAVAKGGVLARQEVLLDTASPANSNLEVDAILEEISTWEEDGLSADQLREAIDRWVEEFEQEENLGMPAEEFLLDPVPQDTPEDGATHLGLEASLLGLLAGGLRARATRRGESTKSQRPEGRHARHHDRLRWRGQVAVLPNAECANAASAIILAQGHDRSAVGLGILHRGPLGSRTVTVTFSDQGTSYQRSGVVRWTRRLSGNVFASGIEFA